MIYEKICEAKKAFRKYGPYLETDRVEWFSYSAKAHEIKMGDFILFQHITDKTISRPILALFVGYSMWDMALVMNYVEVPRAYYYSDKYKIDDHFGDGEYIGHLDPEIETIQFWTDNIKILGHYKSKPTFKELKLTLTKR